MSRMSNMGELEDTEAFTISEHVAGFHYEYQDDCPECFKENRLIQAHKVVNGRDDMLNKHPALTKLDQHLNRE